MMVLGLCNIQALGPKVVTGLGPCRDWVLLGGGGEREVEEQQLT